MPSSVNLMDRAIVFLKGQVTVDCSLREATSEPPPYDPIILDEGAYPALSDDVQLLLRIFEDLHEDLMSVEATVERHHQDIDLLVTATTILRYCVCPNRLRDQLIADLEVVFEHLRRVEDELTSSIETITLHGFKLQHLDLATQMLTEVFAEVVLGTGIHRAGGSKLQRLRLSCEQALSRTAHSTSS